MNNISTDESLLSPDIQEMLDNLPGYEDCKTPEECHQRTLEMAKEIQESFEELDQDPKFVSDYWKMDFGEKLFQFLEKENITKEELAIRLNKSNNYVSRLIKGTSDLTLEKIAELFIALDVKKDFTLNFRKKENDIID